MRVKIAGKLVAENVVAEKHRASGLRPVDGSVSDWISMRGVLA
jgi:hypothetical protein